MDRLEAMALFVAAVEEGSLAAAARRHGRSPAAATRAVALLEHRAGEPLLLRSPRALSLTAAGEHHLAIWREVLSRLGETEPDRRSGTLHGRINLTAPELFGQLKVLPLVEAFLAEHPAVAVRMLMVNRVVDLTGEGIDAAVRLAPLPDSTLTAVALGEMPTLVCASPAYLERAGHLADPRDLTRHECIGLNMAGDGELWPFKEVTGRGFRLRSTRVSARLHVSHAAAAIDAARRGHGLVRAMSYQVVEDLAAGRLVRLLAHHEPPTTPVHLVFHPERARRGALRALIDRMVPALRRDLADLAAKVPPAML